MRYATRGDASREEEAQPFYVNAPYGIILVHNGNLTNTRELTAELYNVDRRHLNTHSDTELLLNVLANELQSNIAGLSLDEDQIFDAVSRVYERVEGSYASIALIAGYGLLAFRDPFRDPPACARQAHGQNGARRVGRRLGIACARIRRLRNRPGRPSGRGNSYHPGRGDDLTHVRADL